MGRAQRITEQATAGLRKNVGLAERSVSGFRRSVGGNIRVGSILSASRAFETTTDRANLLRASVIATTAAFGGIAAALSTNIVLRYADSWTKLSNQIRVVSAGSADMVARLQEVRDVAFESRSGLRETATLYSRIQKAAPGERPEQVLRYVSTIQKALQLGGATAQEASSAALQFSQAIASNRLGGDEFRAILETPLGLELAKGLDVSIGKLREMSVAGELTADKVLGALKSIAPEIDRQFARSVVAIDQALVVLDSGLTEAIGKTDQYYGTTRLLSNAILGLANNAETAVNVVSTLGFSLGAAFAGRLIGSKTKNIFDSISDRSKAARDEVRRLEVAVKDLQAGRLSTGLAANAARRGSEGDLVRLAPNADQAAYRRAQQDILALDEKKLLSAQRLRDAYQNLAAVTATAPQKAIDLANEQIEAERRLSILEQQRISLNTELQRAQDAQAKAGLIKVGTLGNVDLTKEAGANVTRIQSEIVRNARAIDKELEAISNRAVRVANSEADGVRAAAEQRIALMRQVNAEAAKGASLDIERDAAVAEARQLRASAEAKGAEVARQAVLQTTTAYKSATAEFVKTQKALIAARFAASGMGQAFGLLRTAGSSLVSFLGGPWGIAFTGAIALMGILGARAAHAAQEVAEANSIIARELERMGEASNIGGSGSTARESLIARQLIATRADLDKVKDAGAEASETISRILRPARGDTNGGWRQQVTELIREFEAGQKPFGDFEAQMDALAKANERFGSDVPAIIGDLKEQAVVLRESGIATRGLTDEINRLVDAASKPVSVRVDTNARFAEGQAVLEWQRKGVVDTAAAVAEIDREARAIQLRSEGRKAEAEAIKIFSEAVEKGLNLDQAAVLAALKHKEAVQAQADAAREAAEAQERLQKQIEKTADIIDRIKREGESSMLDDLDRAVVENGKNIQDATTKVRAYIDAVNSGDLSKAPKELLEIRDALVRARIGDVYQEIIDKYGVGAQVSQRMADRQKILNDLVRDGAITATQARLAWDDYLKTMRAFVEEDRATRARPSDAGPNVTPVTKTKLLDDLRVSELVAKGKTVEARALEMVNQARQNGQQLSYDEILPILRQIDANEQLAAANKRNKKDALGDEKKLQKEYERTLDIIDRIKREGEASFLGDIDRKVVDSAKNIQNATEKVREYIKAVQSGDLSNAPQELLDIRDAIVTADAAESYRGIIEAYGTAGDLAGVFADKQAQLNYLVANGKITAEQAGLAWADFVGQFGEHKWIGDVSDAFGDFALSAITDFDNLEDSAKSFAERLLDIVLQLLVIEPLVKQIRSALSGNVAGGFAGGATASVGQKVAETVGAQVASSVSEMVSTDALGTIIKPATEKAQAAVATAVSNSMDAAAKAIRTIESGSAAGNYLAKGPITASGDRAYGAYQVMGANVPSWTKQWYGQALSPEEFLKNTDAQDAVFQGQFGKYADRWGYSGAAQAWLGGPGSVGKLGRADGNGTTIGGYSSRFDELYEKFNQLDEPVSNLATSADAAANSTKGLGTGIGELTKTVETSAGSLNTSLTKSADSVTGSASGIAAAGSSLETSTNQLAGRTPGMFENLLAGLGRGIDGLLSGLQRIVENIGGGIGSGITGLLGSIFGGPITGGSQFTSSTGWLYAASGGAIRGPGTGTSDDILAWVSNGEFVVRAAAAAKNRPLLEAINTGKFSMSAFTGSNVPTLDLAAQMPRFAYGGAVAMPSIPSFAYGGMVDETAPLSSAGSGKTEVNIYDRNNNRIETRERQRSDGGRTFDIFLDRAIADKLRNPGTDTGRVMEKNYGAKQGLRKV